MLDFIFYNDRLLLKKDEEGHCHVPDETELPERWAQLTPHHEVLLPNGHMIRTAATDRPVDEDSRWTIVTAASVRSAVHAPNSGRPS